MCGINIILTQNSSIDGEAAIRKMNAALAHRGPDDEGTFSDQGLFFGHRRLSIIDLSSAGHQPMESDCGRYVIVLNGEIYNYKKLRFDLSRAISGSGISPYEFRSQSDTEVVLAAYKAWGKDCVKELDGMFAFAIWDKKEKLLFLARDRFGKKPLYYYAGEKSFLFSSEIKGLLASGYVKPALNRSALCEYFQYQTVHGRDTLVLGVHQLEPGSYALVKGDIMEFTTYWEPAHEAWYDVSGMNYEGVKKRVYELLCYAVEKRLVSDVPFGAFLSGGIDSSAVVGLMSRIHTGKVKTFSVVFREQEFSEQKYAEAIAGKFNTDHTNIVLSQSDFLETLPRALAAMDHPGGDGPNTYVVAGATRKAGIKMALSGIGGDELFAGYEVFRRLNRMKKWWWLNLFPPELRKYLAWPAYGFNASVRKEKAISFLEAGTNTKELYRVSRQVFSDDRISRMVRANCGWEIRRILKEKPGMAITCSLADISLFEIRTYLHSVLLRDTDTMSMAHGLEVRAPFLDHNLAAFVLGVNDTFKYPHTPKKLLTDSLGDLLPPEVIHRKKMGFTLPWEHWMKHELNGFCEERLKSLSGRSFIGAVTPYELWKRFLAGKPDVTWSRLWHLVVLEDWMQRHNLHE